MPLLLTHVANVATDELVADGMDKSRARALAERISIAFCRQHAETAYRVPNCTRVDNHERDTEIRRQYSGGVTCFDLSKKFDLSCRHVRRIVNQTR